MGFTSFLNFYEESKIYFVKIPIVVYCFGTQKITKIYRERVHQGCEKTTSKDHRGGGLINSHDTLFNRMEITPSHTPSPGCMCNTTG